MRETRRWRILPVVLAAALGAGGTAAAQEGPGGGPKEGITVHGEWTLVVRNRDGSTAGRYEFSNALQDPSALLVILARQNSPGAWGVRLGPPQFGLCGGGVPLLACEITETFNPDPGLSPLTIGIPNTGPLLGRFVLKGTLRASIAGSIERVATTLAICPRATPPGLGCRTPSPNGFEIRPEVTGTAIPAIPVQAGQTVDIQVVISLS